MPYGEQHEHRCGDCGQPFVCFGCGPADDMSRCPKCLTAWAQDRAARAHEYDGPLDEDDV